MLNADPVGEGERDRPLFDDADPGQGDTLGLCGGLELLPLTVGAG